MHGGKLWKFRDQTVYFTLPGARFITNQYEYYKIVYIFLYYLYQLESNLIIEKDVKNDEEMKTNKKIIK